MAFINNIYCWSCKERTNWTGEFHSMKCDSCRTVTSNMASLKKQRLEQEKQFKEYERERYGREN